MIYGGNSQKPVPPSNMDCPRNIEFRGPQPYTYAFRAKQPGSNYKIRLRDMERVRMENIKMKNEYEAKSLHSQIQLKEMIDVADRKYVYNQIKRAVECGMKANAHIYEEERPKPKLIEEEKPERPAKITKEELEEKKKKLKIIRDEKERKLVEKKRLQQFIQNSEELRTADIAKRKKDIGQLNYKIIQEKERVDKEQKINKIELANLENLEIFKNQSLAKEEALQKCLDKKHQFRKELYEQVQQLEEIKKQQKILKNIEREDFKKLNEQLNEEEKLKKLEYEKSRMQRIADIKQFTDEKKKLFSKMNEGTALFDHTFAVTSAQNVKDDKTNEINKKIQIRLETDMFLQKQAVIQEERKRESDEQSNKVIKELKELIELERSAERQRIETRRKRLEEGKRDIIEQLKRREMFLEEQADAKRKLREQSIREHEEYLKEKKQLCEDKKRIQLQFRKELDSQINSRKKKTTK